MKGKYKHLTSVASAFLMAFVLFIGIGAVAGWKEREQSAKDSIYRDLEVAQKQGRYYLLLDCRPHYSFWWPVDGETGVIDSDLLNTVNMRATSLAKPSARHMQYLGILGGFLGGATGGVNIRNFFNKPVAKTRFFSWSTLKKNLVTLVAGASGYALGKTLSKDYDTACNSPLSQELLSNTAVWKEFEVNRLIVSIKELEYLPGAKINPRSGTNYLPWKDNPVFDCVPQLSETAERLKTYFSNITNDPTSQQYAEADYLKATTGRLAGSQSFAELQRLSIYHKEVAQREGPGQSLAKVEIGRAHV